MSKINRPPLGLQQLLGSQNFGVNPTELEQSVKGTIDLFPFFGAPLLDGRTTVGARASEGLITSIVLDRRVALIGATAVAQMIATSNNGFAITLSGIPGSSPSDGHVLFYGADSYLNTNYAFGGGLLPYPLVLETGAIINFYWIENTSGFGGNVDCSVLYYDLDPGAA